jgi:formamidopyrimidine-DNA glycosylase
VPELPDVEQFRRFFEANAAGKTVASVEADPTILRNVEAEALSAALKGRRFGVPLRHGKWLSAPTDGPTLLLHFGMTGDLIWSGDEPERHRHDRLILAFVEGGELRYRNMRKLGGVWLAHDQEELDEILGRLGPDALTLRRKEFLIRLAKRRGSVKAALMDQRLVAGIGNIIADEVLWHARIHPKRAIESLDPDERRRLHTQMRKVLREAVDRFDYLPRKRSWLSHVRGDPNARCPRCGTPLAKTVVGRTTYFCPNCQPMVTSAARMAR